jgi:hypothetical protein
MIVKMLTHIHMVVYTWWCWHICKGEEVGIDLDQLGEEKALKALIGLGAWRVRSSTSASGHAE